MAVPAQVVSALVVRVSSGHSQVLATVTRPATRKAAPSALAVAGQPVPVPRGLVSTKSSEAAVAGTPGAVIISVW